MTYQKIIRPRSVGALFVISIVVLATLAVLHEIRPLTPEDRIKERIRNDFLGVGFDCVLYLVYSTPNASEDTLWLERWDISLAPLDSSSHVFANMSAVVYVSSDYHVTYFENLGNITFFFKTLAPQKIREGYTCQDGTNFQFNLWAYYEFELDPTNNYRSLLF